MCCTQRLSFMMTSNIHLCISWKSIYTTIHFSCFISIYDSGMRIENERLMLCYTDIDECKTGTAVCEKACTNLDGSYECECEPQFGWHWESLSCKRKYITHISVLGSSFMVSEYPNETNEKELKTLNKIYVCIDKVSH